VSPYDDALYSPRLQQLASRSEGTDPLEEIGYVDHHHPAYCYCVATYCGFVWGLQVNWFEAVGCIFEEVSALAPSC